MADHMIYRGTDRFRKATIVERRWYRLVIHADLVSQDPVARLDVSLLADHLLEPVLGISDPRTDPRIDFVGGIRGLEAFETCVNDGAVSIAFSLFSTSMD